MPDIKVGDTIGIPCEVTEGAFDNERLVQFDSLDGPVSGFTSLDNLKEMGGTCFIKAEIVEIKRDSLVVMVDGSFFTTNGLANVNSERTQLLAA